MSRGSLLVVVSLALFGCPLADQDVAQLRLSCDAGDAAACDHLAFMYQYGDGVTQDLTRAVSLFQQACDGGDMPGCNNLGFMYEMPLGVTQDFARARSLFQQACDGGEMSGCYNLGAMYEMARASHRTLPVPVVASS